MSIFRQSDFNPDYLDAFSNHRVAPPSFVADGQLTYDLQPLIYEQITAGDGTVTHDSNERCALLEIDTATGATDEAIMQSYEHHRYQAGRAQEVFITFNLDFDGSGGIANIRRFAEYGNGTNGIGLELNGTTTNFYIKSGTSNGDQTVAQASWNIDNLDGDGDDANQSGHTLDLSKTQILVIDIQALYVGRVRIGFDIGGEIVWCHEFMHANLLDGSYVQTANLPIRVGQEASGSTAAVTQVLFICSCVLSRGGQEKIAGYDFSVEGTVTAASGSRTHLLSIRPKTTFNSIENRTQFVLEDLAILNTGSNPIYWELCVGQALTAPTYADANSTYSGFEYETAGTLSGSPAVVFASGYIGAGGAGFGSFDVASGAERPNRYPITLDAAGAVRDMGTLTLLVTGIGGTAACRAQVHWKELR